LQPDRAGFHKHYYKTEIPVSRAEGSTHWFLRLKAITWRCKADPKEYVLDASNCNYQQKWKNTAKDKVFSSREFSWAWFDTGYPDSIVFPKCLGMGDCLEYQQLLTDLKAGGLALTWGEICELPPKPEDIKLEELSFLFENKISSYTQSSPDIKWTITINDLLHADSKRKNVIVVDNPSIHRRCIIFGMLFIRKFSIEFNFDPALYTDDFTQTGISAIGFEIPAKEAT